MTLTTILAIAAGSVAVLALGTFLLPARVHVERSAVIDAAPAEIIALVASNSAYQRINPYRTSDTDLKVTLFGPDSGVGSGFHFEGAEGKGTQTVASVSPTRVVFDIDLGPMGKPTQTVTLSPTSGGTKVTWGMDADMGMNPVARIVGLFMDRMMGKTFDQGLSNLATVTKA